MADERKAYEYSVVVKGLYGRNRKPKLGVFKIARTEEQLSAEVVIARAKDVLRAEKVKPGAYVCVEEQPGTVSDYGDGLTSFSFMVFSEVKLACGWVNADGTLGPKT
jgi:hypothetical protein